MIALWVALVTAPVLASGDTGLSAEETEATAAGSEEGGSEPAKEAVHPEFPDAMARGAGWVTPASPHYDLEVMYAKQQHTDGIALAKQRLQSDPTDPVLVWMIVRFQFELFEKVDRTDASVDKEAVYSGLIDMVDVALAAHPNDDHLKFAKGLAMGRLGTTRGVLSSLFMADDIEDLFLAGANSSLEYSSILGAERLPCDAHVALSVFYRLVPDWFIVKMLSGTRGDLDKAIAHAEKANQCHGGYTIRAWKNVGLTKMCKGYKTGDDALIEQGKAAIRQYKTIKPRIFTEHIDIKHADAILEKGAKYACEYSRDGQQDLDKSKLEDQ